MSTGLSACAPSRDQLGTRIRAHYWQDDRRNAENQMARLIRLQNNVINGHSLFLTGCAVGENLFGNDHGVDRSRKPGKDRDRQNDLHHEFRLSALIQPFWSVAPWLAKRKNRIRLAPYFMGGDGKLILTMVSFQ